jgi:hypothetical protein
MNVWSNVSTITNGVNLAGGNIEFWPSNYGPLNSAKTTNASNAAYDWGDSPTSGNYGSMQIHNHDARQVLFAFNRWGGIGGIADVGIGNNTGNYLDWTGSQNAGFFEMRTLEVYALPMLSSLKILEAQMRPAGRLSIRWEAKAGFSYSVFRKLAFDSSPWTKVGGLSVVTDSTVSLEFPATNSTAFYRIAQP